MGRYEKLLGRIMDPRVVAAIRFHELRFLLLRMGFVERVRGSHHLFRHPELGVRLNLQASGSHAKPYQVRQVRRAIVKYKLERLV